MNGLEVIEEKKQHFDKIRDLLIHVFDQKDEADLVERIRSSEYYIPELSMAAFLKNELVGHIIFSRISIQSSRKESISLALAPLTVAKKHQRKGIGSTLILKGMERASNLGYQSVILLGHAEYYPRFGFEPTSTWNIKPPFYVPKENFMGIELVPDGLVKSPGIVRYPDIWQL